MHFFVVPRAVVLEGWPLLWPPFAACDNCAHLARDDWRRDMCIATTSLPGERPKKTNLHEQRSFAAPRLTMQTTCLNTTIWQHTALHFEPLGSLLLLLTKWCINVGKLHARPRNQGQYWHRLPTTQCLACRTSVQAEAHDAAWRSAFRIFLRGKVRRVSESDERGTKSCAPAIRRTTASARKRVGICRHSPMEARRHVLVRRPASAFPATHGHVSHSTNWEGLSCGAAPQKREGMALATPSKAPLCWSLTDVDSGDRPGRAESPGQAVIVLSAPQEGQPEARGPQEDAPLGPPRDA